VKKKKTTPSALAFAAPFLLAGILAISLYIIDKPKRQSVQPPIADLALLAETPMSFKDSTIVIEGIFVERCDLPSATCYTLSFHQRGKRYLATILTEHLPPIETGCTITATVIIRKIGKHKVVLIETNKKISPLS